MKCVYGILEHYPINSAIELEYLLFPYPIDDIFAAIYPIKGKNVVKIAAKIGIIYKKRMSRIAPKNNKQPR